MKDREKQLKNQREWYRRNKEYTMQKQRETRRELRRWFREEVLADAKCGRCGEDHPATFDFHHIDPNTKEFSLSEMSDKKFSRERVLKELEKCEILCANCHRKHHFEERVSV